MAESPTGFASAANHLVEDVGVDHRGLHVRMCKELMDGADVVAVLQEMRGERVPQRVTVDAVRCLICRRFIEFPRHHLAEKCSSVALDAGDVTSWCALRERRAIACMRFVVTVVTL